MLDIKPLYCINLKLKVVQPNEVEHHYHGCEQCSYIIAQNYTIGAFNKQREVTEKKKSKTRTHLDWERICTHTSLTSSSSFLIEIKAGPVGREIQVSFQLSLVHRCW